MSGVGEIELQVMWNRLIAVVEEQAQVLLRTAFSSIVREAGDLSTGVFDPKGRMLAQAVTGTPGHVNSMALAVPHFIERFPLETMKEGDIYITNDPWLATGHLNDFTVVTPAFHQGKLVGLFACTSHLMDIGGLGCGPDATDVFMEGLYVPHLKLAEAGKMNATLLAMIRANTRLPIDSIGDVYSLAACNDIGCKHLGKMMDEFSLDDLERLGSHIYERSRAAVLAELTKLPKGSWSNTMIIDGYNEALTLAATVTVTEAGIDVDYAGTSLAVSRGINVPLCYTTAYTVYPLACIVAASIPNNTGSLSPFTVSAPEGSLLNAPRRKPVSGRHNIGHMLPDVVLGCLRQAMPERIPAEGASGLWLLNFRGELPGGQNNMFSTAVSTNGGQGARPMKDGLTATGFPSGVKATPIEIAEAITPLVFWKKELRPDSGGPGKHRGGLGQTIEIARNDNLPFEFLAMVERIHNPARGSAGGMSGASGYVGLKSGKTLKGKGAQIIPAGDRLVVLTPGGGGIGDPVTRERSVVERDVAEGYVSADAADKTYGRSARPGQGPG
jgi:N-methylhydantoinase B